MTEAVTTTEAVRREGAGARRGRPPLLGVFPLAVMSLATFLVVFSLLMARLAAGEDPATHPGHTLAVAATSGRAVVRTRASGAATGTGPVATPASAGAGAAPAPATRTSGGTWAAGADD